jgi:hypothetical protein
MTGIAELYRRPHSKDARARLRAAFQRTPYDGTRFVVLSWKRTGSNLLCDILHRHPDIVMHNELFNPIDTFSYHQKALLRNENGDRWTVLERDLWPKAFLEHIWTWTCDESNDAKGSGKAIGFKSFPDHWTEVRNEHVWQECIMDDYQVKKVVLYREDELAVFISMKRAELTGNYMTLSYPEHIKLSIDPARFQAFVNNYRDTYRRKYKSPLEKRDTFRVSYEQIIDEERFESEILPLLWDLLGVDSKQPLKKLRETRKQADPNERLEDVVKNYDELEYCFRHSDVLHFIKQRAVKKDSSSPNSNSKETDAKLKYHKGCMSNEGETDFTRSWSLLLPICSRAKAVTAPTDESFEEHSKRFNTNRLIDVAVASQYNSRTDADHEECWQLLLSFAKSLALTSDNPAFNNDAARARICEMIPCEVVFAEIRPEMYGRVCQIWNHLARRASNKFILLLGDDIVLLDNDWQRRIVAKFREIAITTGLPFGAACVAMKDISFPGFPTFPVVHRWHITKFGSLLPKQFVNQGGDPYLFELYSRFNAAAFEVTCKLVNTIGGDEHARYPKYDINWRGQLLRLNLLQLGDIHLGGVQPSGICLDVVIPSYRVQNNDILKNIISLRASIHAYVRFWIVVDNSHKEHVYDVKLLAKSSNEIHCQANCDGNYFVNVVEYGENRGASYARNIGYNYSTSDWTLFIDDDVIPDEHLLDAYIGAIKRYPHTKVFVGLTELPPCCNKWTEMLRTCNIIFFYGVAKIMTYPPWGVTANMLVRGSRHNSTIQFKHSYPKTGGGEDIDFVFQFKAWYHFLGSQAVVSVPGAKAQHPWWRNGSSCYGQINGWAWGDSLCITQWPDKTFISCPNWIEIIFFGVIPWSLYTGQWWIGLQSAVLMALTEHILLTARYYPRAAEVCDGHPLWHKIFVAAGAGTPLTAQELMRAVAMIRRLSPFCLCRRLDLNDGQLPRLKLETRLSAFLHCVAYIFVCLFCLRQ